MFRTQDCGCSYTIGTNMVINRTVVPKRNRSIYPLIPVFGKMNRKSRYINFYNRIRKNPFYKYKYTIRTGNDGRGFQTQKEYKSVFNALNGPVGVVPNIYWIRNILVWIHLKTVVRRIQITGTKSWISRVGAGSTRKVRR